MQYYKLRDYSQQNAGLFNTEIARLLGSANWGQYYYVDGELRWQVLDQFKSYFFQASTNTGLVLWWDESRGENPSAGTSTATTTTSSTTTGSIPATSSGTTTTQATEFFSKLVKNKTFWGLLGSTATLIGINYMVSQNQAKPTRKKK